jgi:hypothetical protein
LWSFGFDVSPEYSHAATYEYLSSLRSASPSSVVLFAEVAAARLVARERVHAHQLAELEEVGHAAGRLERLVELRRCRARLRFSQNSARSSGIFASAFFRSLALRAMPQLSQMTWPSSRWKESGERLPSCPSACFEALLDVRHRLLHLGVVLVDLGSLEAGEVVREVLGATKYPSARPCISALAPRRFAPWSEKFASPAAKSPGMLVIRL